MYSCDAKKSKRGVLRIRDMEEEVIILATF
jgi:hypothetical protein